MFLRGTGAAGLWGMAACAPHPGPSSAPSPSGAPARGRSPSPAAARTAPLPSRYVAGPATYEITSVGTVSSPTDSSARPDTIITLTSLTYDARWVGPELRLTGQVRSRVTAVSAVSAASGAVRSSGSTTSSGASSASSVARGSAGGARGPGRVGIARPPGVGDSVTTRRVVDSASESIAATIDSATGAVHFSEPGSSGPGAPSTSPSRPGAGATSSTTCGSGPTIGQARELATDRPRSFALGTTWRDTLSDTTCLGGVPLVTQAVRDYTVESQTATDPVSGAPAILVSHRSRASMHGDGRRSGQLITLDGSGDGTTQQFFDRTTGIMLSAHTTATLDLDVGVNGRAQHLHQQADWRAKLVRDR